jgi:hypothetical protein
MTLIGNRYFICIGTEIFPVDRVNYIDTSLDSNDPGAVRIELSNPNDELVWEEISDVDAIRKFLRGLNLNVG